MSAGPELHHSEFKPLLPEGNYKLGVGGRVYHEPSGAISRFTVVETDIPEKEVKSRVDIVLDNEQVTPEVWILHNGKNTGVVDRMRTMPNCGLVEVLHCNGTEEPLRSVLVESGAESIQLPLGVEINIPPIETDRHIIERVEDVFRALSGGLDHSGIGVSRLLNFANIPSQVTSSASVLR